ncbi:MAG: M1 family aminopeptidase, partial [Cryomorphaceae bacterium]
IMNDRFGSYPYPQFSVIQGGDGGMEYPMCTMISGSGSFGGLVSVTVHEAIHNWFYGVLATNETKYPWMDEGFTKFAQDIVLDSLFERGKLNPHKRSYDTYIRNAIKGNDEPLSTPADHYETNEDYAVNAYYKGCVFLNQLSGIVGQKNFDRGMKAYFNQWKYKHPTPREFKRIMEKTSGLELDWYFDAWIGTTKTIDYGIRYVAANNGKSVVELERIGSMPMPLELLVVSGGENHIYYIPLQAMQGAKSAPESWGANWHEQKAWPWTYPYYQITLDVPMEKIERIRIDPFEKLGDIDEKNDAYPTAILSFPGGDANTN